MEVTAARVAAGPADTERWAAAWRANRVRKKREQNTRVIVGDKGADTGEITEPSS